MTRQHGSPTDGQEQGTLWDTLTSDAWDLELSRRALDELFVHARQYRSRDAYRGLLDFIVRFRSYSPFNAMLVRTQMSGARFVAPASRWWKKYGRRIKPDARPLVILQPMGPVMFVFDVSDTAAGEDAPELPPDVENPFPVDGRLVGRELSTTIQNAARDGVEVHDVKAGSQGAGLIRKSQDGRRIQVLRRAKPEPEYISIPVWYDILLNQNHTREEKYSTLVHELAHLYCGHLGTPDRRRWPDRPFVGGNAREFEAESVSFLVCRRLGIKTPSESYLAGYLAKHEEVPDISLDTVMKAAGLIEQMGKKRLPQRESRRG